ncbi:flagellar biosynthesis anti-sigma factor FlgM [Thaumasiovibrio sp. DFM-14]|uniref:flagellar biosynthesis anti-sigma factor FlgM n=1 Tax=Thaumasiovibrio sp. DFM-14 TaxID=3384792 RepID=UPI0039A2C127
MIDFNPSAHSTLNINSSTSQRLDNSIDNKEEQEINLSIPQQVVRNVSEQAKILESIRNELHEMPDVDLDKVEAIREQLENGEFELDLPELAQAIKETHDRD